MHGHIAKPGEKDDVPNRKFGHARKGNSIPNYFLCNAEQTLK
jgi:hypothetical protein